VFSQSSIQTVYYRAGTSGWGAWFCNIPTVKLNGITFAANPPNGAMPLTVSFTSSNVDSTGNTISSWNWTFGDGSSSTAQNPSHTYTTVGTFYPTLFATNSLGAMGLGTGLPAVSVGPPFCIVGLSLSGANLVLNGSNGVSGGTYYVLMSSNLPMGQWTYVATNVLSANGNFTITVSNTVDHNIQQQFYILQK